MALSRPFRRTVRQLADGSYANSGHGQYITHPKYAQAGAQYVRSYLLLQKDLLDLFDYVEPSATNRACYSYRIHALLLRACVEVEANLKAILRENDYPAGRRDWKMDDYRKVEFSHGLSGYRVAMPLWTGSGSIRQPFKGWAGPTPSALPWYQAYNSSKHDRHAEFEQASFENLIDACCGLVALLYSQFRDDDFSSVSYWTSEGPNDGSESAVGGYFRVLPPRNLAPSERYDFDWQVLKNEPDPFEKFDFTKV